MPQNLKRTLEIDGKPYSFISLKAARKAGLSATNRLPKCMKILLENVLRRQDNSSFKIAQAFNRWANGEKVEEEISFYPARVIMQDFTGVPAILDLAAIRDASPRFGKSPDKVNPLIPVDLVIDHSISVDFFADADAYAKNVRLEYERNLERYTFLKWGQSAFDKFRVIPPGVGIIHQINLEFLAKVVWQEAVSGETMLYPDTVVGTDSHTTMVNGLAVLGWGVGGIEAEAAMLGQPVTMSLPDVVGVKLTGELKPGISSTDLVLTVTELLRKYGVVGKFVEYYGPGLAFLTLEDRAVLANMSPEYGATCGFFPIDGSTLAYLQMTGRSAKAIRLVEAYAREQGLWGNDDDEPRFTQTVTVDLSQVNVSIAGPRRPQDRIDLEDSQSSFNRYLGQTLAVSEEAVPKRIKVSGTDFALSHGDIVIAAITSCTNTSSPALMISAGLVAQKARARGLRVKPWVKTSLAPGSRVVSRYLIESGLQADLDDLGFNLVGYGCTTCIGNSGPLPPAISEAIHAGDLAVASILSGNRNFEGRINPDVKANYLAAPALVVAFALAGRINIDLTTTPLGQDYQNRHVFLSDIWPSSTEVTAIMRNFLKPEIFVANYQQALRGDFFWQSIDSEPSVCYSWQAGSSYILRPPFLDKDKSDPATADKITDAAILALFGDCVTTDHISPAGSISEDSPAGQYLIAKGIMREDFNSYGSRRGNHEVMMRGTFANIRIRNEMVRGVEGGYTRYIPDDEVLSIYEAAMRYQQLGIPLVVIAGEDYGIGSSRDWAAKGTHLLGVRAVIAESFERIHRSNLIGMKVLPVEFMPGVSRKTLNIQGDEQISIELNDRLVPGGEVTAVITRVDGGQTKITLRVRIDTDIELEYFLGGGILPYVCRSLS